MVTASKPISIPATTFSGVAFGLFALLNPDGVTYSAGISAQLYGPLGDGTLVVIGDSQSQKWADFLNASDTNSQTFSAAVVSAVTAFVAAETSIQPAGYTSASPFIFDLSIRPKLAGGNVTGVAALSIQLTDGNTPPAMIGSKTEIESADIFTLAETDSNVAAMVTAIETSVQTYISASLLI
jgi:hypothetical protein